MQKPFAREGFPARVGPAPFLGLALLSQTGMSLVQQGLVILGTFFAAVYHLNLTELGLVTTALSLGVMVSMVFVGAVVDRLGPRVVLFWGAALMAALSLLLLLAQSFAELLVVLFFVGIALAIAPSTGTKAVFTAFADRPRGLVMGIRQTGVPLGAAIAAWLLPKLAPQWGLQNVYLLFALELLAVGWAFSSVMRQWERTPRAAGISTHLERVQWKPLLRPVSVAFLMVAGQYILLTDSITALHRVHHLSLGLAGLVLATSQVGGGTGRIVLGQVSDRVGGRRPPVVAFAAFVGAVMAVVAGILPGSTPVALLFVVWLFFGASAVGWNALVLTWSAESVPAKNSGLAMGLTGSIVFLGSAIYPPLFGAVVDLSGHMAVGWWMLAAILLAAGVIAGTAGRKADQSQVRSSVV